MMKKSTLIVVVLLTIIIPCFSFFKILAIPDKLDLEEIETKTATITCVSKNNFHQMKVKVSDHGWGELRLNSPCNYKNETLRVKAFGTNSRIWDMLIDGSLHVTYEDQVELLRKDSIYSMVFFIVVGLVVLAISKIKRKSQNQN